MSDSFPGLCLCFIHNSKVNSKFLGIFMQVKHVWHNHDIISWIILRFSYFMNTFDWSKCIHTIRCVPTTASVPGMRNVAPTPALNTTHVSWQILSNLAAASLFLGLSRLSSQLYKYRRSRNWMCLWDKIVLCGSFVSVVCYITREKEREMW